MVIFVDSIVSVKFLLIIRVRIAQSGALSGAKLPRVEGRQ